MRELFAKIIYETEKHNDVVLVTLTGNNGSAPRKTGAQMLVGEKGLILGTIGGGAVEKLSIENARDLISLKRSDLHPFILRSNDQEDIGMICGGTVTALFPVAERVIIFGGGHIAAALVPLLSTIGFRSWVFDDRPEFTASERFPRAEKCITGDFTHIEDSVTITAEDYIVIMTNGHRNDLESELHVLRGSFAYVGVIGSRRKTAAVNEKLREQGIPEEKIAKVHTPIGTAIKAVTPEEIAVSIAGELILVRAERREAAGEEKHHCPMH